MNDVITYKGYRITLTVSGIYWVPAVSKGGQSLAAAKSIIDRDIKYHAKKTKEDRGIR